MAPKKLSKKNRPSTGSTHGNHTKRNKLGGQDEFDQFLSDLNKATMEAGLHKTKQHSHAEKEPQKAKPTESVVAAKTKPNDVEVVLRNRQREVVLKELYQLLMMPPIFLRSPNTDLHSRRVTSSRFKVAITGMQGWRVAMEDATLVKTDFAAEEGLFGVFDGHSGSRAAERCSVLLPELAERHRDPVTGAVDFEAAFLEMDARLAAETVEKAGSTAVVVHVTPRRITCAAVGDSRAVLCRHDEALDLSFDHKPDLPQEKARIVAAGGFVQNGRVNGELAMSRAMGDFTYKSNPELGVRAQQVIAVPDVIAVERDPQADAFVVLACDGIFDVLTNHQLVAFILQKKAEGLEGVAIGEAVCRHCLAPACEKTSQPARAEGTDNMSIILVELK